MSTRANDRVWFYYANKKQIGPLPLSDLKTAVRASSLGPDDYVYREGFPDWKKLREVEELSDSGWASEPTLKILQATQKSPSGGSKGSNRRASDRAPVEELVLAHNDEFIVAGSLTDISPSGVFFETERPIFSVNDEIKLTLKEGRGLGKPMNLRGTIVRQTIQQGRGIGYGLELLNLDLKTRAYIVDFVKRNRAS